MRYIVKKWYNTDYELHFGVKYGLRDSTMVHADFGSLHTTVDTDTTESRYRSIQGYFPTIVYEDPRMPQNISTYGPKDISL